MYSKILRINPKYSITFQNGGFLFPCSFHQEIQENYSEDKIYAVLMTVFLSSYKDIDNELIHTLPFIPTVHSNGKCFPRHFRRTNSLLSSL